MNKKYWLWGCLVITLLSSSVSKAQTSVVCTDSDKGINLEVKGELQLKFYQNERLVKEQSYTDFFSGSRNRYLEFYCNGTKPAYEVIRCPNETLGRACPVLESLAAEPKIQVSVGNPLFPKLITSGAQDVPILNFNLTTYDGDVDLKGLHFVVEDPTSENLGGVSLAEIVTADLYLYELYDASDNIIAQTKSVAGRVFFNLEDEDYVLSGSNDFTVKVDMPAIDSLEESWRWFRLSLDKDYLGNGVQGVSTESGKVVEGVVLGQIGAWPSSELFLNAATNLIIKHAAEQPPLVEPSLGGKEFYRFDVEAGRSDSAQIEQLTLAVLLEGMEFDDSVQGRVFALNDDGSIDYTNEVTDEVVVKLTDGNTQSAQVIIDFKEQVILSDEAKTYTLFLNRTKPVTGGPPISYAFNILTDSQKSSTREARLLKTASNIVWSDFPIYDNPLRFMRGFLTEVDTSPQVFID